MGGRTAAWADVLGAAVLGIASAGASGEGRCPWAALPPLAGRVDSCGAGDLRGPWQGHRGTRDEGRAGTQADGNRGESSGLRRKGVT